MTVELQSALTKFINANGGLTAVVARNKERIAKALSSAQKIVVNAKDVTADVRNAKLIKANADGTVEIGYGYYGLFVNDNTVETYERRGVVNPGGGAVKWEIMYAPATLPSSSLAASSSPASISKAVVDSKIISTADIKSANLSTQTMSAPPVPKLTSDPLIPTVLKVPDVPAQTVVKSSGFLDNVLDVVEDAKPLVDIVKGVKDIANGIGIGAGGQAGGVGIGQTATKTPDTQNLGASSLSLKADNQNILVFIVLAVLAFFIFKK